MSRSKLPEDYGWFIVPKWVEESIDMAAKIVQLEKTDPRGVIEGLEELLQRAKDGEFDSFIAVCLRPDGSYMTRTSGCKNTLEMIGALQMVQYDLAVRSET